MAFKDLDKFTKKYQDEYNKLHPEQDFDDTDFKFPESVEEQFKMRSVEPDPSLALPESSPDTIPETIPPPELISPEDLPEPTFEAPPIDPSSFDVDVSTRTPRMEGREGSLPSSEALPEPAATPERKWELEEDAPASPEAVPPTTPTPTGIPTDVSEVSDREEADKALLATGQDEEERARILAGLEKKRKFQAIPEFAAGIGDAISASASAFGGNAPGGSMERMTARHDKQLAEGKTNIDVELRNDAESDVSKQYQNLLAQMMQKDPSDTAILGLTANQIAEKIPTIERMMQRRSTEDLKKLALQAAESKRGADFSPAQKKFDEEMAKSMVEFNKEGGIKVAKAADASLKNTINRFKTLFESGKVSKIPGKSAPLKAGKMTRFGSRGPDLFRGLYQGKYKAIEQEVRSNVTELLRSTLGAQFTEKEGERIFSQTFDPTLHPDINLRRMENLQVKLKTIADERARATDWYNTHKTFDGYNPQSDANWLDNEDYYDRSAWDYSKQRSRRKTKSGVDYNVSDQ